LSNEKNVKNLASKLEQSVLGLKEQRSELKILIVDDNYDNLLLLESILSVLNLKVKKALNGKEAVEVFQEWKPDFIWMDRRMPIMDGADATRKIRLLDGGKNVKIVALTASAFNEDIDSIISSGMDDFITKPYKAEQIFDMMQKCLGLEYIYKNEADSKDTAFNEIEHCSQEELIAELSKLDKNLVKELQNASLLLDSDSIKEVISKISDKNLQKNLIFIVEQYNYHIILEAISTIQGSKLL
jgi:CheY-like chemotaxis protein